MNGRPGTYVLRNVSKNGREFICEMPGQREQWLAERAEHAAEAIGEARLANLGSRLYDALTAAHRELCDFAFDRAMAASRALGNAVAQEFTVECEGCGEPHDFEATEAIGDDRYCRPCAAEQKAEAADMLCSDWFDSNLDRGL